MTTVVTSVTRRVATLWDGTRSESARLSSRCMDALPGDIVVVDQESVPPVVKEYAARRNMFSRSVDHQVKQLAANVDLVGIVTSVLPLFNVEFIDRVLTLCSASAIPAVIIVNKVDKGLEDTAPYLDIYRALGYSLIEMSAKFGEGIDRFEAELVNRGAKNVVLTGVSGVGKSTLINRLVPSANARVGEMSLKSGQGKQTTTQAQGYIRGVGEQIVFDLPGIQKFGVGHIGMEGLYKGFPEIVERYGSCPFDNCSHIYEDDCAIKAAVDNDQIAEFRYASFISMALEIGSTNDYERDDE